MFFVVEKVCSPRLLWTSRGLRGLLGCGELSTGYPQFWAPTNPDHKRIFSLIRNYQRLSHLGSVEYCVEVCEDLIEPVVECFIYQP